MRDRGLIGELLAEFLGTAVLVAFGDGVVAMVVLEGKGDYLMITFAWGFAVVMGIYIAGKLTGAHLNPAVTLSLALRRGFPWSKVLPYMAAELVGGFVGGAVVFLTYQGAFNAFNNNLTGANGKAISSTDALTNSLGVFSTAPNPIMSGGWFGTTGGALFDQIIGTALLVLCILAVVDALNQAPQGNLTPLIVGIIVVVIGMAYGGNAGYAINPARDLGPRLWAAISGWGSVAFSAHDNYFWVPIVGPLIGGPIGAYIYDFLIHNNLVRLNEPVPNVRETGETDRVVATR